MLRTHIFKTPTIIQPNVAKQNFSSTAGSIISISQNNQKNENSKNVQELNEKSLSQLEEICELRRSIIKEKSYGAELEQKISEIEQFIKEYGLYNYRDNHPECLQFINGVSDINKFRTQITLLNDKVHVHPQKLQLQQNGANIRRVIDVKPMKLELLANGFAINGDYENIRKYSNPLNAHFLYLLSVGTFPDEIRSEFPEGIRIDLVDSTKLPDQTAPGKKINSESERALEPLTSPEPLGEGNGMIKIRLPSGNEQLVRVKRDTKICEILELLDSTIGFAGYELFSTFSNDVIPQQTTIDDMKLFPKGMLNAKESKT